MATKDRFSSSQRLTDDLEEEDDSTIRTRQTSSSNSSTLSLHIIAYDENDESENNFEATSISKNYKIRKSIKQKSSVEANLFEFPRQQQDKEGQEMIKFKATQKLVDANQKNRTRRTSSQTQQRAKPSTPNIVTPSARTPKERQPKSGLQDEFGRNQKVTTDCSKIENPPKSIKKVSVSKTSTKTILSNPTVAIPVTEVGKEPSSHKSQKHKKASHQPSSRKKSTFSGMNESIKNKFRRSKSKNKKKKSTVTTTEATVKSRDENTKTKKLKNGKSGCEDKDSAGTAAAAAAAAKTAREKELRRDQEREKEKLAKEARDKHKVKELEISSSSSSEAEPEKPKPQEKKPKKNDGTITVTIEKKETPRTSKRKKKNNSQDTDNSPTVFEEVHAPVKPVVDDLPVRDIGATLQIPKKGTGKAAVCVDNTPTAYGTVQPKKKSKREPNDSSKSDDSDYLPIHPSYVKK